MFIFMLNHFSPGCIFLIKLMRERSKITSYYCCFYLVSVGKWKLFYKNKVLQRIMLESRKKTLVFGRRRIMSYVSYQLANSATKANLSTNTLDARGRSGFLIISCGLSGCIFPHRLIMMTCYIYIFYDTKF